jgi:hypothetical protein
MANANENPELEVGFCTDGTVIDIPESLQLLGVTPENPTIHGHVINKLFKMIFENLNHQKKKAISFWEPDEYYIATENNIDICRRNNKIYFCKQTHNDTGDAPKDPATNPDYWGVLLDLSQAETLQFFNGNAGLNALPKNWQGYKAYEVGILSLAGGSTNFELGSNFYYDGTNFRYKANGKATRIASSSSLGGFSFYYAVDGVADAVIPWTKAYEVNNSGVTSFVKFPLTPSSNPTNDYDVANKKYVDENSGMIPTSQVLTVGQNWNGIDIGGGEKLYPDGSICGQNVNGYYTKYPNGDLVCSLTKGSSATWQTLILPYAFISSDYKASILMHTLDSSTYTIKYTNKTTTSFQWAIMLYGGSFVTANADIIVKGKWK